jgi:competence protein ComEC
VMAAAAVWAGACGGIYLGRGAIAALTLAVPVLTWSIGLRRGAAILALAAVGITSGITAAGRIEATLTAPVPSGPGTVTGVAVTDPLPYGREERFILQPVGWQPLRGAYVSWAGPAIVVVGAVPPLEAGSLVSAAGLLRTAPDMIRGDPVAARISVDDVEILGNAAVPLVRAGNLVRARVQGRIGSVAVSPATALLSGFLIGDVAGLPDDDVESLRRAGLTHFVAVSGSNVALVLGAWWLVIGPFGAGVRARAVTGLLVLAVFVVATRWEPSVIRAATMAALVLGSRAVAVPLDAWTALGGAAAVLLAASGDLAVDVGFQLSAAATAGVLAGATVWRGRRPRWLWTALVATVSAQLAVVPLLLAHFGSVPLLSPVANLVAAPLVTGATALGVVGVVLPWNVPLGLATVLADGVLRVARVAGGWPQLGPLAVLIGGGALVVVWRTRFRSLALAAVAAAVVVRMLPAPPPGVPTVTFIDVGQGDATLIRDPGGGAVLVDGGRDPAVLRAALRRYGVGHLDVVVATHGDTDHAGGLLGVQTAVDVDRLWIPVGQGEIDVIPAVVASARADGVPVEEVAAGRLATVGEIRIELVGPRRRYASENDGSVILWISARGHHVLVAGDAEAVAQRELPALRPDVLLVPHHGSATSDLEWLRRTVGAVAIVSVGPNTYGHPDPEVIATLEHANVEIHLTENEGDISVPLP